MLSTSASTSISTFQGYYEGQLSRLSANFAVSADLALVLGGRLKFEEMLSGRFADAFGTLYLGYACCWYYSLNRKVEGIDEVFELAMENLLLQNQTALNHLSSNFPIAGIGPLMKVICTPFGNSYSGATDKMTQKASNAITTETGIRALLSEGIFISNDPTDRLRMMNDILPKSIAVDKAMAEAKKGKRNMTVAELEMQKEVLAAVDKIIQVDVFDKIGSEVFEGEDFVRPALRNTKFAGMGMKMAV